MRRTLREQAGLAAVGEMKEMEGLIEHAIEKGEATLEAERRCRHKGGHYKTAEVSINGQPGWKCECGFSAIKSAPVWAVKLNDYQRERIDDLWFYYGNNGPKHSLSNHKYIQHLLHYGSDKRDFYKPDEELLKRVDDILADHTFD